MSKYKVILKIITEAWKLDKIYFLYLFLNIVFQTLSTIVVMYIPAIIVDKVSTNFTFENIILTIGVYLLAAYTIKQVLSYINMKFSKLTVLQSEKLAAKLSEKSLTITYKELENPQSLDLIQRAEMPISWGYVQYGLDAIKNILIATFTILGLVTILVMHSLIYTIVVFIILVVSMVVRLKMQQKYDNLLQQNVPVNRKYGYFFNTSIMPEFQKEFRLYDLSNTMSNKITQYNKVVAEWIYELSVTNSKLEIFQNIFSSLITFIAISYNAIRLFSISLGSIITVGQFTLIYNATNTIMTNMDQIARSFSMINGGATHLQPWKEYIELEDDIQKGKDFAFEFESLEFKNVSFTYPNSDRVILDNISFKINKGEKISIVGLNNAGKSTIVKLICRFFVPDSGEILWNGKNIYQYENSSYIDQISAVFQDFRLFPYTIFENIMPNGADRQKAEDSLKQVNMFEAVSKLEKGLDTYLSKDLEENATRFSGGQSQKLAIARAINKGGSLMIMDEPTAALDPIAESEIFENFADLTKGKTSIFISHRMSSSTFSDKVLLLDGGKIVGFDSHKNLMKEHNLYRDLFETQAKNYVG